MSINQEEIVCKVILESNFEQEHPYTNVVWAYVDEKNNLDLKEIESVNTIVPISKVTRETADKLKDIYLKQTPMGLEKGDFKDINSICVSLGDKMLPDGSRAFDLSFE